MAYVDLDKIINVTGGGGSVYPGGDDPAPYPVLSQSIGIFNKPDAWNADASEGWFGLLGSSNAGINSQNTSRNTQYAAAIMSGTGALSSKVKSYPFSTNIDTIDAGRVVAGLYFNNSLYTQDYSNPIFTQIFGPNSSITYNEVTKKVATALDSSVNISNNKHRKGYLIQSGANYFVVASFDNTLVTYPSDAIGNITGPSVATQVVPVNYREVNVDYIGSAIAHSFVVGNNGSNIFVMQAVAGYATHNYNPNLNNVTVSLNGYIYNITSTGTFDATGKTNAIGIVSTPWTSAGEDEFPLFSRRMLGSYVSGLTAHVYAYICSAQGENGYPTYYSVSKARSYLTVNMTNTTTFTRTSVYGQTGSGRDYQESNFNFAETEGDNVTPSVGYDGTRLLVVAKGTVWIGNAGGFSDSTNACVFANKLAKVIKTNSMTVLTTAASNVGIVANEINIAGTLVTGTFTDLYLNCMHIHALNGTNEDDTAFLRTHINTTVQVGDISAETIDLSLVINGNAVETKTLPFFPAQTGNRINTTGPVMDYIHENQQFVNFSALPTLASPDLEVEVLTTNPNARDIKMGIGLTGGNYTTPTGANNLAGNATTPWSANANSSYLSLTLSTN